MGRGGEGMRWGRMRWEGMRWGRDEMGGEGMG
jgi:hypothetical protein